MIEPSIPAQISLIAASLDDFTASSVMPDAFGGQDGGAAKMWRQSAIRFLTDCLDKKLIAVCPDLYGHEQMDAAGIARTLTHGNPDHAIDSEIIWHVIYFEGTDKLRAVLKRFGLFDWPAIHKPLSKELFQHLD